jgi:hypothetical protein
MKALLTTTAVIEATTGVALLAVPAWLASVLLGSPLDTPAGVAVARVAGAALLTLGVASGLARGDTRSQAAIGIVAALLIYNHAVAGLLVTLRYGVRLDGMGLLPSLGLHAALAAWWIAGFARADRQIAARRC